MHQRQAIRSAFVTLLTGNTSAGSNVYKSRVRALWQAEELPAILVYTLREDAEVRDEAPRKYARTAQVAVEIVARATDDLDDVLDGLAEEVEAIIFDNRYLAVSDGGSGTIEVAGDTELSSTEVSIDKEGDELIGAARLTFDAYYEQLAIQTSALDDLSTVTHEWQPDGNPEPADHLHDEIKDLEL